MGHVTLWSAYFLYVLLSFPKHIYSTRKSLSIFNRAESKSDAISISLLKPTLKNQDQVKKPSNWGFVWWIKSFDNFLSRYLDTNTLSLGSRFDEMRITTEQVFWTCINWVLEYGMRRHRLSQCVWRNIAIKLILQNCKRIYKNGMIKDVFQDTASPGLVSSNF